MVKSAPLGSTYAGTVHPGRYLILVSGDTASVEVALDAGRERAGSHLLDTVFLADIHPDVTTALIDREHRAVATEGEAVAVIEAATVATVIDVADAGVKAAPVTIATIASPTDSAARATSCSVGSSPRSKRRWRRRGAEPTMPARSTSRSSPSWPTRCATTW